MVLKVALVCLLSVISDFQIETRRLIQPPEGDRLLSGVLHQPIFKAYKGVFEPGPSRYMTGCTEVCAACHIPYP